MTLTEFLLARIDEDEAEAEKAGTFTPWTDAFQRDNYGHLTVQPARILAECQAKREIVASRTRIDRSADGSEWAGGFSDGNYDALHALACVYADHPDYREEWRP